MKTLIENKRGQFIIIAMLMIAIMIISAGALMHKAVTYYKHEPWEEYLTLMGNIELGSRRLVELSLSNYTNTEADNTYILRDNLGKWQSDLTKIYPGSGASLDYKLANGTIHNYTLGLRRKWNQPVSFSAAKVNFTLDIASIGLVGHKFEATALLNLTILNTTDNEICLTVRIEDGTPITNLKEENFQVSNLTITSVTSKYDETEVLLYTIKCDGPTASATVKVWDERGIQVSAKCP